MQNAEQKIIRYSGKAQGKVLTIKNTFDNHSIRVLNKIRTKNIEEYKDEYVESLDYTDRSYSHKKATELIDIKIKNSPLYNEILDFFTITDPLQFSGRFLNFEDYSNQLPWHNDYKGPFKSNDRIIGFSIYLDELPEIHTSFEMKCSKDNKTFFEHKHHSPGDMTIFILDREIEHRVKATKNSFSRNTFSGWGFKK
jgi:hypothetical protein